ncbi:ribosome biogenesis protein Nop16 [Cyathus striatus]|nr:ribosome biogenesis protein Nop16 [Cyathus striatus]
MANPRQRRKTRSSSHRPVSHSRHAKRNLKKTPPLRAPKILQDAWDKHKTVKQNYISLGLVHDLNPNAPGGSEQPSYPPNQNLDQSILHSNPIESSSSAPLGRIIRDESGAVVRVELLDGSEDHSKLNNEELPETEVDGSHMIRWVTQLGQNKGGAQNRENNVVEALECISAPTRGSTTLSAAISGIGARCTAGGERTYLERLVQKYGYDVEKMSRDRKLNPEQRTTGELRRALRRAGLGCQ